MLGQLALLTGKLEDQMRSSISMDDFFIARTRVARNEACIVGLIHFRNSVASSSPSRDNMNNERNSILVFSGNRDEPDFF